MEAKSKTCSCGHGRNHPLVELKSHYTIFGWILILSGVSKRPEKVTFRCQRCGEKFDEVTDPQELVSFVNQ